MARPRKEIDPTTFEKLCGIQCTKDELCGFFDVTDKTLDAWAKRTYQASFSDVYKKYSANGKMSLRRMQFKIAEKNASMAIWLGKQYLGQREPEAEIKVGNLDLFTSIMKETPQI